MSLVYRNVHLDISDPNVKHVRFIYDAYISVLHPQRLPSIVLQVNYIFSIFYKNMHFLQLHSINWLINKRQYKKAKYTQWTFLIACQNGTYWQNCMEKCRYCLKSDDCYHANGTCVTGWKIYFKKHLCKKTVQWSLINITYIRFRRCNILT